MHSILINPFSKLIKDIPKVPPPPTFTVSLISDTDVYPVLPVTILPMLVAIVWNVASAAVETPLSVTAAATRALPSLTDVFSSLVASDDRK